MRVFDHVDTSSGHAEPPAPVGTGVACNYTTHVRSDGGLVRRLDPSCFRNPLLDVHTFETGWSPAFCRRLRRAAEKVNKWTDKSSFSFGEANPSSDVGLELLGPQLLPRRLTPSRVCLRTVDLGDGGVHRVDPVLS